MIWCRREDETQGGHWHCILSDLHFYACSPDRCSTGSVSLSDRPVVLYSALEFVTCNVLLTTRISNYHPEFPVAGFEVQMVRAGQLARYMPSQGNPVELG
jgi:hypothetical protein